MADDLTPEQERSAGKAVVKQIKGMSADQNKVVEEIGRSHPAGALATREQSPFADLSDRNEFRTERSRMNLNLQIGRAALPETLPDITGVAIPLGEPGSPFGGNLNADRTARVTLGGVTVNVPALPETPPDITGVAIPLGEPGSPFGGSLNADRTARLTLGGVTVNVPALPGNPPDITGVAIPLGEPGSPFGGTLNTASAPTLNHGSFNPGEVGMLSVEETATGTKPQSKTNLKITPANFRFPSMTK